VVDGAHGGDGDGTGDGAARGARDRARAGAGGAATRPAGGRRRRDATTTRLELLPARHGDALWLEYGPAGDRHRILVDGGPREAWDEGLGRRLATLDGPVRVDLAVCTHVDADHIDGMVRLLQHPRLELGELWFNGWRHVHEAERGAVEGEILGMLGGRLADRWNAAVGHGALVVPPTGPLPRLALPGGATATLLSPGPPELRTLAAVWARALGTGTVPGDADEAVRLLEDRPSLQLRVTDRGEAPSRRPGSDRAPANGSSLAFLLELDDHRLLLTGDAHADVLEAGVRRLLAERGLTTLPVDVVKLAHHGSIGNVTAALLGLLDVGVFAVTTNGDKFHHPDPETLELVAHDGAARGRVPAVVFSYRSPTTLPYAERTDLAPHYPPDDGVSAIELGPPGVRLVGATAPAPARGAGVR
jgi:hypothetical protein